MKYKVTNTKTGQFWIEENEPHSWEELTLDIQKDTKCGECLRLIYCDMEGIVFLNGAWLILDECNHYCSIPDHYTIKGVK